MSTRGVYVSLPEAVLQEIDKICGGPSLPAEKKRAGTTGGRAAWVRSLIYEALDLTPPEDIHQKRKQQFQELVEQKTSQIERDDWPTTLARLRELRKEGLSLRQIAKVVASEGRKTRRGGKWSAQTVRNALLKSSVV